MARPSSPWRKSRGPRYGQTGPDSRRRRSADPKSRRSADPKSRRSADPKSRRSADPKSRRSADPKSRRSADPKSRRGAEVAKRRRPEVAKRRRSREDATMLIHWKESATTKTAPFRRNPLGAGGSPTFQTEAAGAPQALSGIVKAGHDEKTAPAASVSNLSARSSLRACNLKTPGRGPRGLRRGLLRQSGYDRNRIRDRDRSG